MMDRSRQKIGKRILVCVFALGIITVGSAREGYAATLYDETVSGDFPGVPGAPAGTVALGDNLVIGTLLNDEADLGIDVFLVDVPTGLVVNSVLVSTLDTTGFDNSFNIFLSDPASNIVGSLNVNTSGLLAGDDLLQNTVFGFTGPLTAGTWEFDLRGFGESFGANEYSFNLVASAVPIPAAVWLFGSGLLGLVGMARRKKV